MLKVLVVHNRYSRPGGEDEVVAAESDLLRRNGHQVIEYFDDNSRIEAMGRSTLAATTLWSRSSAARLAKVLRRTGPDLAHFHNTFPLISPSAYYACHAAGVPVVQTLHNYRLVCPNALLLRGGRACELCLGRTPPWPGIVYACYRNSRIQTAVVAAMLTLHRRLHTWQRLVNVYVALTEFEREIFVRAGFPANTVFVKPNFFYPDFGPGDGADGSVLFVGRLAHDKGLDTLLEAWRRAHSRRRLVIVGDGPLSGWVAEMCRKLPNVEWLGHRPRDQVIDSMRRSAFLVVPSLAYEAFPLVLAEAFSAGLPAVVSGHGALAEIVRNGDTGLHFKQGDPADLSIKIDTLLEQPAKLERMRRAARAEYESKYSAEQNYPMLMRLYESAVSRASTSPS